MVPVIDTFSRGQSGISPFPISKQEDLKIAYITLATTSAMNNLADWKRIAYMTCYNVETNSEYVLQVDLTTWLPKDYGVPANVVTEDEIFDINGYIQPQLIQNIFLNASYVVSSEAAMLALTSYTGNFFIRTDNSQVYIKLNNDNPSDISDFAIANNPSSVISVNGQIGVVNITIGNLLAVPQNLTDFNYFVTNSTTILQHSSAIVDLQNAIDGLSSINSVNKDGDNGVDLITFLNNKGIDSDATAGTDVLNIGTVNADVINIGRTGAIVNLLGTINYQNETNLAIEDKLIRLNVNGAAASGSGVGFEIEEDALITGYFKTNGTRDGYLIDAPAIDYYAELLLSSLTANRTYTFPNESGTLALVENTISSGLLDNKIYLGDVSNEAVQVFLTGDITTTNAGVVTIANNAITTAKILNSNITKAKIENITDDRLLGRDTGGVGVLEEIGVDGGLEFSGAGTIRIANSGVTYAKIQDMTTSRILGRVTAGSGIIEELTGTQATTLLNIFTDALKGLVPLSGGGTANFLRADGTWASPSGSGHVIFNGEDVGGLTARANLRVNNGLNASDDDPDTLMQLGGPLLIDTIINGSFNLSLNTKNISLFSNTPDFESGEKIVFLGVSTTVPTAAPTNGVFMWVELINSNYELRIMDSAGNIKGLS